jgi:hypothetical protein
VYRTCAGPSLCAQTTSSEVERLSFLEFLSSCFPLLCTSFFFIHSRLLFRSCRHARRFFFLAFNVCELRHPCARRFFFFGIHVCELLRPSARRFFLFLHSRLCLCVSFLCLYVFLVSLVFYFPFPVIVLSPCVPSLQNTSCSSKSFCAQPHILIAGSFVFSFFFLFSFLLSFVLSLFSSFFFLSSSPFFSPLLFFVFFFFFSSSFFFFFFNWFILSFPAVKFEVGSGEV